MTDIQDGVPDHVHGHSGDDLDNNQPDDRAGGRSQGQVHDEHDHDDDRHHDHPGRNNPPLGHHHGGHEHDRDLDHDHEDSGLLGHLPFFHQHRHGAPTVDPVMESSAEGLRTLALSLAGLAATAIIQLVIAVVSGSAGLLADTIHNGADALTALPLGLAFVVGRRPPTRRYSYGFGRAEDLAGVLIVVIIFGSALLAAYESIRKLIQPQAMSHVWWVAGAALIGCLGNEGVALLRIRTGERIGSAALVADGQHARVDGLTSLAVLVGALLSAAGLHLADPIVGLLITLVILFVVRDSAQTMWYRLMDAVDPELIDRIAAVAAGVPGVAAVGEARARYNGHKILADVRVLVDGEISAAAGHGIAEAVQHALMHDVPRLAEAHVHIDPAGVPEAHALTAPHQAGDVAHRHAD